MTRSPMQLHRLKVGPAYTDSQPTERNSEYTLKLSVKCNQNNYAKAEAIIVV